MTMIPAAGHEHDVALPDLIEIVRAPHSGSVSILVDGEPLPWAVSGSPKQPVSVDLAVDFAPGVTLTLMAKRVAVRDDYLAGVEVVVADDA